MLSSIEKVVLHILTIIHYAKDKNDYKDRLIKTFIDMAFVDLFDSLPKESQDAARKVFASDNQEEIDLFLKKFYSEKEYKEIINKGIIKAFHEYIKNISKVLTLNQKKEIITYIASLNEESLVSKSV